MKATPYAFRELFERSPAKLFVIVATSHCSRHRFTLTRKHFQTPLGTVPTDQAFIDRLVAHYGDGLFDDEFGAHWPEHSIELEVVFLQYLYEKRRDIRIVPLLVGSFADCVQSRVSPGTRPDIRRMADALRAAEREAGEPVCYVISGDLAHIGPFFGDEGNLRDEPLAHSRRQDKAILDAALGADPDAYFRVIADEGDERRICGLPPTWLTLAVAGSSSGRMLHYDQYIDPRRSQSVFFAQYGVRNRRRGRSDGSRWQHYSNPSRLAETWPSRPSSLPTPRWRRAKWRSARIDPSAVFQGNAWRRLFGRWASPCVQATGGRRPVRSSACPR